MLSPAGLAKRPGTRGSTQSGQNPTAGKSREELLRATISPVHNIKTAKEYLESKCYVIIGEEYSPDSLSLVLLHLSQTSSLSKVVVDGLRAIALLLENMSLENLATQATKTIVDLLLPTTEQLTSTLTDLQLTTNDLRGSAVSITRTADEFRDNTSCFGTRKTIGVKEVHLITNGLTMV